MGDGEIGVAQVTVGAARCNKSDLSPLLILKREAQPRSGGVPPPTKNKPRSASFPFALSGKNGALRGVGPGAGTPPLLGLHPAVSWIAKPLQLAGAVGKFLHRRAHPRQQPAPQIRELRVLLTHHMPPRGEGAATLAGDDDGEVARVVRVAVAHAGAEDDHRVIQQRPLAFADAFQLLDQVGVMLDVPGVDALILREFVRLVFVVRGLVVPAESLAQEAEAAPADRIAKLGVAV